MVHLVEDEDVQVAEVARHEQGHDLALAVRQDLVAAREAVEDEEDVLGLVALLNQILASPDLPDLDHQTVQGPTGLIGEGLETLELACQRMLHRTALK